MFFFNLTSPRPKPIIRGEMKTSPACFTLNFGQHDMLALYLDRRIATHTFPECKHLTEAREESPDEG